MPWRDTLLNHFGPGLLGGVTLGGWVRLLRDNRFAVSPSRLASAGAVTSQCLTNSLTAWYERRRYGAALAAVQVPPPLFVLGHWRSGTTHLHNLLTVDSRFAFPNNYQVFNPHTFLTTEAVGSRWMGWFLPGRRPMDNVEWDMRSPQEDEFALCADGFRSPCLSWAFPRRRDHYDRYLTLRGLPESEVSAWRAALLAFLRKLTLKYNRPLVLKSPPHTCRIKLLLEMFPGAKFVHIRRDPFAVFRSTTHNLRHHLFRLSLQRVRRDDAWTADLHDRVLRDYRTMYDVFFEERALIPPGHFHEVAFESLERDPLGEVRRTYEALSLPDFAAVEPALRRYVDSLRAYKKNEFPPLPPDLRRRIAAEWRPCFEAWGYDAAA